MHGSKCIKRMKNWGCFEISKDALEGNPRIDEMMNEMNA